MADGELDKYKAILLEETNDIVLITDSNLNGPYGPSIKYVNNSFETLTGYSKSEVIRKTPRILQGPKTDNNTLRRIKAALKDGREYLLDFSVTPLLDENDKIAYFAAIERDVTQHKQLQINLHELAHKDQLTGAMNRNRFYEACGDSFAKRLR